MKNKKIFLFIVLVSLFSIFPACQESIDSSSSDDSGPVVDTDKNTSDIKDGISNDHEEDGDYVWNSADEIPITLNGNSVSENSDGVEVEGNIVTITSAATYRISGQLNSGQIKINTDDADIVRLILDGAEITCTNSSPIYVVNAEKVIIILADNTENKLTDGSSYVQDNPTEDEPNATIYSKCDLTIYSGGTLTVKANYNDGISSKDGLVIRAGKININSIDDGIRGKDYVAVKEGSLTINASGIGLKSDNSESSGKGYISIESGDINITSGSDALKAETEVLIASGNLNLTTGGGSSKTVSSSSSAKGIKGLTGVVIDDGVFNINSADDAVHSNSTVIINGGTFNISSGDDGIHADSSLGINGGTIIISKCYEGIESAVLTINDGYIQITSSDDGVNGAGGQDGSGMGGWPGGMPSSGNYYLYINGGYIYVNAKGDGIDVNGGITMTGGTVIVNGPTVNNDGPIDYDSSFKITGGFLLAVGSSGMAQIPGTSSTQCSVLLNMRSTQSSGTMLHIQTASGTDLVDFIPVKNYQSIAYSSPDLKTGSSYDVFFGGSSSGTNLNGLYTGGTYTQGTKYTTFTISSVATKLTN